MFGIQKEAAIRSKHLVREQQAILRTSGPELS